MAETVEPLPVAGTIATDSDGLMLVLSQRLDGFDTYLTGRLTLGVAPPVTVQILTLDDVTVLRLLGDCPVELAGTWTGLLYLPAGRHARSVPDDLATAARNARRDLAILDNAELRYALTYLAEASTDAIRRGRIEVILDALPLLDGGK